GTIDIKRGIDSQVPHPTALVPQNVIGSEAQHDSLMRLGQWVAENGISGPGPFQPARDLLLRQPPRVLLANFENMYDQKGGMTDTAVQTLRSLCAPPSVLPLQGPPGSGKSYTGARMIVELVRRGHRIGVTAVSHKVISNLLQYACSTAKADNIQLSAVQKANDSDGCEDRMVEQVDGNDEILNA